MSVISAMADRHFEDIDVVTWKYQVVLGLAVFKNQLIPDFEIPTYNLFIWVFQHCVMKANGWMAFPRTLAYSVHSLTGLVNWPHVFIGLEFFLNARSKINESSLLFQDSKPDFIILRSERFIDNSIYWKASSILSGSD